ncbi:MAG: shikimate kinase, partial [Cyanobacteriota bacterium]
MPFSGKTTLGKSVAKYLDCPYISLDEINEVRGLYGGNGIPVEEWEKTHFLAMQQLQSLMPSEQNIVLDDTNCFRWLRDRFRNFGAQYGYQTSLIFLDISLTEIWQRIKINNQTQTRNQVKSEIIIEMAKTFESPQADEKTINYNQDQSIDNWI